MDDQRTVTTGSGSGQTPDSAESAPTQIAGSGGIGQPVPKPGPPEIAPFRPPFEPPVGPARVPPFPAGGETMLMKPELESQIPLAWLAVVEGPGGKRGTIFTLKPETVVGRVQGDYLLSGDRTVSSQHIKIRLEPKEDEAEGKQVFILYDLASANGTYAGTRQTYRDESSRVYRHELKDGDYVLVGETTLVFKQVDA